MRRRHGFTLLELIVSIAVTGVIALLVYGSASAGFDTRDALARHRAGAESELRTRVMLMDALRHASDEANPGTPAFDLVDAFDARGLPADELRFLTRGVLPPFGASALWTVTLTPSANGLLVAAAPGGAPAASEAAGAAVSGVLAAVRGVDVEVMSIADRRWTTEWPSAGQLPAAVRITFYDAAGQTVGPPIVVRLGLEPVR